jgi:sugar-phosphatase
VEAVVLDMDGVLIDSEPVWHAADIAIFAELGIELTQAQLFESLGRPIGELVPEWRQARPRRGGEASQSSDVEIVDRITNRVVAHVRSRGKPMPGVMEAVGLLRGLGVHLAIASSSPSRLIDAVCAHLGLEDIEIRRSTVDEARGKPAPDVYLRAASQLRVEPDRCVGIEDSPNGVLAVKAAGMRCIAVPNPAVANDPRYHAADLILASLTRLDEAVLRSLGWRATGRPSR